MYGAIMNNKHFFDYLIEKIKRNKDVISVTISFCVLMNAILFVILDTSIKDIFTKNYLTYFVFAILFMIIIFVGILVYLRSEELYESYDEIVNLNTLKCPKRDGILLDQKEYQKKMQIYLLSELEEIEKNVDEDDQIWVLTSDVKLETTVNIVSETMKMNLNRGVKYKYYIPDTVKNNASVLELKRRYKKYSNFELIKIDSKYKFLFERFDVIIYSPDRNFTEGRSAFICVNFSNIDSSIAFKKITEEDTKNLIGQLQHIGGL